MKPNLLGDPLCHCEADFSQPKQSQRLPRSRLPSFGGQVARNDKNLKWLDIACR